MKPAGYLWLIEHFSLRAPEPYKKSFLTTGSIRTREIMPEGEEEYFPARFLSESTWKGHLLFALKNEGINLFILKAMYQQLSQEQLITFIQSKKTSVYLRKVWFFYEFLTGRELSIPPLKNGNYDYVLSPDEYFVLDHKTSFRAQRQRLICNLPGNADFCPMVRMTKKIKEFLKVDYQKQISDVLNRYPAELIYRAGQFLYLKETKSSYAIERQTPNQKRTNSFMTLLSQAGRQPITKALLLQLQNTIVDERYAETDYRHDQVYVGQTIRPGHEFVHFIGAKPEAVSSLMSAFLDTTARMVSSECNSIIPAALLSFAFVFIHPFDDGNGRIHRYLMHHILAEKKFCPGNIIFPVSAVLYKNAAKYDWMLERFSKKLLPLVEYRLDDAGVMTVENDTTDYYRYINFTGIVEDFFEVIEDTLKTELIPELDYLWAWDRAREKMRSVVDLPEQKALQIIMFLQQNQGKFPCSRRKLFEELTEEEIAKITEIVRTEILECNNDNNDFA